MEGNQLLAIILYEYFLQCHLKTSQRYGTPIDGVYSLWNFSDYSQIPIRLDYSKLKNISI